MLANMIEKASDAARLRRPRLLLGLAASIFAVALPTWPAASSVEHVDPTGFSLIRIWNAADHTIARISDRTLQCYETIRLVYRTEHQLKALEKGLVTASNLNSKADRTHQFERVAVRDNAGAQPVVELDASVHDLILEMDVRGTTPEVLLQAGKSQVVCCE
jgi:hypothetical protein